MEPGLVGAGASWELFLSAFSWEIQWESHQSAAFLVAGRGWGGKSWERDYSSISFIQAPPSSALDSGVLSSLPAPALATLPLSHVLPCP